MEGGERRSEEESSKSLLFPSFSDERSEKKKREARYLADVFMCVDIPN